MHRRFTAIIAALALGATAAACGDDDATDTSASSRPGPEHIHGVGVNPKDGALFLATHRGLFRAGPEEQQATPVGKSQQDTMGFTVIGPDRFLGSGHPDLTSDQPPLLGLISSDDAGASWKPVSLLGEADFHVLRSAGTRIYGFDSTQGRLMVSDDGGRTWAERQPPAPLVDLVVDPRDTDKVIASGPDGLFTSDDAGERWTPVRNAPAGYLAWAQDLVVVGPDGTVHRSTNEGRTFAEAGDVGGEPAAMAQHEDQLFVATHANEVKRSTDGGLTWTVRLTG